DLVTGVQTCALPICITLRGQEPAKATVQVSLDGGKSWPAGQQMELTRARPSATAAAAHRGPALQSDLGRGRPALEGAWTGTLRRSEERRVGAEWGGG